MTYTIYALFDARELDKVRYVGFSNNTARRLKQHFKEATKTRVNRHKSCWIRKVLAEGSTIVLEPIQVVGNLEDAVICEIRYIAEYRHAGHPLTNDTDGGEGFLGLSEETQKRRNETNKGRATPEYRAKQSATHKSLWTDERRAQHKKIMRERMSNPETRAKMSVLAQERSRSVEGRARLSAAGKAEHSKPAPKSLETRAKLSAAARSRSSETRAKLSAAQKGKKMQPRSDESRERSRAAGNKPETRAKMSAAGKARAQRERDELAKEQELSLFDTVSDEPELQRYSLC